MGKRVGNCPLTTLFLRSQMPRHLPVVPASVEAMAGGSLELRSSGLTWPNYSKTPQWSSVQLMDWGTGGLLERIIPWGLHINLSQTGLYPTQGFVDGTIIWWCFGRSCQRRRQGLVEGNRLPEGWICLAPLLLLLLTTFAWAALFYRIAPGWKLCLDTNSDTVNRGVHGWFIWNHEPN